MRMEESIALNGPADVQNQSHQINPEFLLSVEVSTDEIDNEVSDEQETKFLIAGQCSTNNPEEISHEHSNLLKQTNHFASQLLLGSVFNNVVTTESNTIPTQKISINDVCAKLLSSVAPNEVENSTNADIKKTATITQENRDSSDLIFKMPTPLQNFHESNVRLEPTKHREFVRYPKHTDASILINNNSTTYKSSKLFTCVYCSKSFTQNGTLKRHTRIHTGHKPYKCSFCEKSFSLKSYLDTHMRIHTGEKPYQCLTCGKRFSQPSSLTTHMKIHSNIKPYVCETCGLRFAVKSYLTVHERKHTGEKPYRCGACGKTFTQGSSLNVHLKKHVCTTLDSG